MVVVQDLWFPVPIDPRHRARLNHVDHVAVTVVVVADVFLVQLGRTRRLVGSSQVVPVPVDNHVLAVRVDREPEDQDDVFENRSDLGISVPCDQVVGELDRVLCVRDFACVEPTIDVNDRLAFSGQVRQLLRRKGLPGEQAAAKSRGSGRH